MITDDSFLKDHVCQIKPIVIFYQLWSKRTHLSVKYQSNSVVKFTSKDHVYPYIICFYGCKNLKNGYVETILELIMTIFFTNILHNGINDFG